MGYQENEEVYLTLPRKELQSLCREHGLPVNRNKKELAGLLVAYFTKKAALKERQATHDDGSSKSAGTEHGLEKNEKEVRRSCRRKIDTMKGHGFRLKENPSEKGGFSQVANKAGNFSHVGDLTHSKGLSATPMASLYTTTGQSIGGNSQENKTQQKQDQPRHTCVLSDNGDAGKTLLNTGHSNICSKYQQPAKSQNKVSGECSSESGLASSNELPGEASFQFFVRSEEGINLFVDLNTRPSDWIISLKDEVSIYQETRVDKSWTISNEMREVGIVDKSSRPSGMVSQMNYHEDFNRESRSHALTSECPAEEITKYLDEENQIVSSSCMTCSRFTTGSGSLSCATDSEVSLHNPTVTSLTNKTSAPVSTSSLDKKFSNQHLSLSTYARASDDLNLNVDKTCHNTDVSSPDDSFNGVNDKGEFSLFKKSHDILKLSESDGSEACPTSLLNGPQDKCLLLPETGQLTEHACGVYTCTTTGNQNSTGNEKWEKTPLKDKMPSGYLRLNKSDESNKSPSNSDSRRRSIRLGSK